MALVERDHVTQALPSNRSDQPFAVCIRLRRSNRCLQHLQSEGSNGFVHFLGERRVPIMYEEAVLMITWYGFT